MYMLGRDISSNLTESKNRSETQASSTKPESVRTIRWVLEMYSAARAKQSSGRPTHAPVISHRHPRTTVRPSTDPGFDLAVDPGLEGIGCRPWRVGVGS